MLIRHLKTFLAIADTGSFNAAAEKMNITQSAVSMQMKNLEIHMNLELFERSMRPPRLSNAGAMMLEKARSIVEIYDDLMQISPVASQMAGSINIGTIPGASFVLPKAIKNLRKSYRQLQVRVSSNLTSELSNQVLNGKIDGALITLPDNLDKELIVRPILNEPLMVLAPIDQSGKTDVELLKRNSFISFNRRAAVSRIIEIELRRMKIEVDAIMELDTLEIFHTMILEGLGVGILPMSSVRNHLREKLYMVPFGSPPVQRKIVMVQLENHHRQPMLDRVYNALVTSAQKATVKYD
jgi:DNA-binding transcriptional LysR family regulator